MNKHRRTEDSFIDWLNVAEKGIIIVLVALVIMEFKSNFIATSIVDFIVGVTV